MSENQRSNSVTKIRNLFRSEQVALTLRDIADKLPELKTSEISMTLCYLVRQRYAVREKMDTNGAQRRKQVWLYTYSDDKYPLVVTGAENAN